MEKFSWSIKRKLIQIAAFGFANAHPGGFFTGQLYSGRWKKLCAPGLNCYSCPAAGLSCPIGALQTVGGTPGRGVSLYVLGLLLAVGVFLGRAVCAFLCPFGLLQELLYKIPLPRRLRENGIQLPGIFRAAKYVVLAVLVLLMPALFTDGTMPGEPFFCKYLCPAGTLEAGIPMVLLHRELRDMIGGYFIWKLLVLAAVLFGCLVSKRFFCKYLCPLGAFYGLFNRISILRPTLRREKCTECGACEKVCPMSLKPVRISKKRPEVDSAECIRCGNCAAVCPSGALDFGVPKCYLNRGS